jgi:DNA-binding transcriptional MerR regulator
MSRAELADSRGGIAGSDDPERLAVPRDRRPGPGELFRAGDVVQIVQVSRRQLQYWAQTDLIRPSAKTPGGHGRYTFEDLVALKAAKRLIDAGVSVQRIRSSIGALRRLLPTVQKPLSELVLVATGDVVLAFKDGTAFDTLSGQEWVFEVARFQREVEDWRRTSRRISRVRPARPTTALAFSGRNG